MAKRAEKKTGLYLQIVRNGKMGMFTENPTDNSDTYTNSEGKTRNYEFYDEISGKLAKVYCYDKEFGAGKEIEMFVITLINSEGNKESVTMPFNSNYAQSFIKRLEGIDLNSEIVIKTFKIKDKEKSAEKGKEIFNELCLPYQKNKKGELESVKNLYTKDSENKIPEATTKTVKEKGKSVTKYDFTAQKEALRDIIKSVSSNITITDNEAVRPLNEAEHDKHLATEQNDMPF